MKYLACAAVLASILFLLFAPMARAQTVYPNRGGTGITTTPSYGQVLVGNTGGTYSLFATSSLGLPAFATTSADYWLTTNIPWSVTSGGTGTSTPGIEGQNWIVSPTGGFTATSSLVISPTGSVGIGSTSPSSLLTVESTAQSSFALSRNKTSLTTDDVVGAVGFYTNDISANGQGIKASLQGIVDNAAGNNVGLRFLTSNGATLDERVRVTSAGLVGIGTTTPDHTLDIAAAAASLSLQRLTGQPGKFEFTITNSVGAVASLQIRGTSDTTGSGDIVLNPGNSATAFTIFKNAGNVGIATSTPQTKLDITSASNSAVTTLIRIRNTGTGNNTGQRLGFALNGANVDQAFVQGIYLDATRAQSLQFGTGGSLVADGAIGMTLTGQGNVGIGTTSPLGRLNVDGGSAATTTTSFGRVGDVTSKACFNTKNTSGADVSFYFIGTTMTVENNLCR